MKSNVSETGQQEMKHAATKKWDVAVIGGGPAGLAAAALAAQGGCSVVLLEGTKHYGGRSASTEADGAVFNLGAHALYRKGAAERVLERLGVRPHGKAPTMNISWLIDQDTAVSTMGLLLGGKLGWMEKRQLIGCLVRIRRMQPEAAAGKSWRQQLIELGVAGRARDIMEGMGRLGTYAGDADKLDAGAAIMQLQKAVMYPDGGWQSMIDAMVERAQAAGAQLLTKSAVTDVTRLEDSWTLTHNGGVVHARQIIAAVSPAKLNDWFGPHLPASYARSLSALTPMTAACLDVHLRRLPHSTGLFTLGAQQPLYLSVHSRWANLTQQQGHAVVHTMRYHTGEAADQEEDRLLLEKLLDRMQPGWRKEVVRQRYLPRLVVSHASPTTELRGVLNRPSVLTGVPGVYAAGDWAGNEGHLLDAALASGEEAAQLVLKHHTN